MKKALTAAVIAASCLAASQAHALRVDKPGGGSILIDAGDSIVKAQSALGRAARWDTARVCKQPTRSSCRGDTGWGTRHQYIVNGRTFIIDEYDGVITQVDVMR
ncbi:hypothetical protein [Marinobacterium lutimaris]|uniref:Nickel/cobalt transporter regulator n=1 Tax=Marinobacterium lutimaris TaxID=568106 RepID=A0A1H5XV20_9GAMM|nr:hypothetical protein [Marinobacterium lutimaris]SEG15604.1 hypothetical protein SAMN05444390_1011516 [Marinobacterium lutimaris]